MPHTNSIIAQPRSGSSQISKGIQGWLGMSHHKHGGPRGMRMGQPNRDGMSVLIILQSPHKNGGPLQWHSSLL